MHESQKLPDVVIVIRPEEGSTSCSRIHRTDSQPRTWLSKEALLKKVKNLKS